MATNIKERIKNNKKVIIWAIVPIAILALIFAIPFKTVPVKAVEKYWDTEIKKEPYNVTESYIDMETYITTENRTEIVYDNYISNYNWSYTVDVKKPGSTVTVQLLGYPYTNYPMYYFDYPSTYNGTSFFRWPSYYYFYENNSVRAVVKVNYTEDVPKQRSVTKYRDVVKYRDVPTQVLKERTVTQYVKTSIWGYLFMDVKPE